MVQRIFFTRNRLWHFRYIDLKLNGFDIIQTKKAGKSSCFLQFTQCVFNLENYIDSLRRCCGATSQPRIKRTPQSIGTKVSLIIYFFLSATNQHFVFFFFHLWQRYSLYVLCILLMILLQWTMLSEIPIHFGRMI